MGPHNNIAHCNCNNSPTTTESVRSHFGSTRCLLLSIVSRSNSDYVWGRFFWMSPFSLPNPYWRRKTVLKTGKLMSHRRKVFATWQHAFFRLASRFSIFITSILKSPVILAIWLALSSAIYSQIALFFALNRIFFSANENETVKQNNQSDFKFFFKPTSHIAGKWKTKRPLFGTFGNFCCSSSSCI